MTTRVWTPSVVSDDQPSLAALITASASGDSISMVPGARYSLRTPNTTWKAGGGVHLVGDTNKPSISCDGAGWLNDGSTGPFILPTTATTPCNFSNFIFDGQVDNGVFANGTVVNKGGAHTFTGVESKDFYFSHIVLAGATGVVIDGWKMTQLPLGDTQQSHGIDTGDYTSDGTHCSGIVIKNSDLNNWIRVCTKAESSTSHSFQNNKFRSKVAVGDTVTGSVANADFSNCEFYSFLDYASAILAGTTVNIDYCMFDEYGGTIIVWTSSGTLNLLGNDFRGRNDWVGWTGATWASRANVVDLGGNRRRNKPKSGGKTVFVWQGNVHQDANYAPYATPNTARVTGSVETSVEDVNMDETNIHHAILDDIHLVTTNLAPQAVSQTVEGYGKVVKIRPAAGLGSDVAFVNGDSVTGTGLTFKWKNLLLQGWARKSTGSGFKIGPNSVQNNPNTHEFHNVNVEDASIAGAAGGYGLWGTIQDGVIVKFFGGGGANLISEAGGAGLRISTRYGIEFHGFKLKNCQSLADAGGAMRLSIPDDGAWAALTAYSLNDRRRPVTRNGFRYKATTAGASGAGEPTWPTTVGTTVADGTAVWTCANADMVVDGVALVNNYALNGGAAVYSSLAFKADWNGVSLSGNTCPAATGKQILASTTGTALTLNNVAAHVSSGDNVQFSLTASCSFTNAITNGALPNPCGGSTTNSNPLLDTDGKPQTGSLAIGTGDMSAAPNMWGPDLKPFRAKRADKGAYRIG